MLLDECGSSSLKGYIGSKAIHHSRPAVPEAPGVRDAALTPRVSNTSLFADMGMTAAECYTKSICKP